MRPSRPHAPLALALALLAPAAAIAGTGERRLVNLGIAAATDVDPKVERTLEDTVASHVVKAARVRGYELVPLRRVSGLEEEAARCQAQACRREILRRLKGTHGLSGSVERLAVGYRVSFWLEDAKSGELIRAVRLHGEVPALVGGLRAAVEEVLEAGSPKDAAERQRLAKAGRAYLDKGRYDDAVRAYREAVDLAPFHPDAARLFGKVLDALQRAGDEARLLAALDEAIETYGPRSAWARAGIGGGDVQRDVHRHLRAMIALLGTEAHKEALALGEGAPERREKLERARDLYRRYAFGLGFLGDDGALPEGDAEAAEMVFYLGEVQYELGAFAEAAEAYEAVRETKARQREDAAVNALFALEKVVVAEGSFDPSSAPALQPERRELPPLVARYVRAADRLVEIAPRHAEAPSFLYRAAAAELAFGRKEEGRARLSEVVKRYPKTAAGRSARGMLEALK